MINRYGTHTEVQASTCAHCNEMSYWIRGVLMDPAISTAPHAHADLPVVCMADYNEARNVFDASPKAAGALLRLCIQKLLKELGQPGDNINQDIAALVRDGLPPQIQKALDVCRVVGNNAVHPGEIAIDENPEVVGKMFGLINFVVEDRITRPKEVAALYDALPEGARDAIDRRDGAA